MGTIAKLVWAFIGPTLISLALNEGLPEAIKWAFAKGLPTWLVNMLTVIIKAALAEISEVKDHPALTVAQKKTAIKVIKKRARIRASAITKPADLKGVE